MKPYTLTVIGLIALILYGLLTVSMYEYMWRGAYYVRLQNSLDMQHRQDANDDAQARHTKHTILKPALFSQQSYRR
jgi:uncharacterized protein YxeA